MSIIKLSGVELVQAPLSKCKYCKATLTARKLEVLYASNQKKGHTAYLAADVWYCMRCDRGYALSAFKTVMDASNRSWTIVEAALPTPNPLNSLALPAASSSGRIDAIDRIIADEAEACANCGGTLIKRSIELMLSNHHQQASAAYIPCEALQCAACRRWMLRRQHYVSLQASHAPFEIQVVHTDRVYQSPNGRHPLIPDGSDLSSKPSGASSGSSARPKQNKQFNKYGVFIPAPTNKKGYFDE